MGLKKILRWKTYLACLLGAAAAALGGESPPQYSCYNKVLKGFVCTDGVAYDGLKTSGLLDDCLQDFRLQEKSYVQMEEPDRIAYLTNLYNFFTLRLIAEHYPLASIRDIKRPWKRTFVPLFGKQVSLDHIEHEKLRKDFDEPRIHFAVNCASIGCPSLHPEPFHGKRLEQQLDEAALSFLRDTTRNRVEPPTLKLSRIFDWYGRDFNSRYGSYRAYVQKTLKLGDEAKAYTIEFLDYDWSLNDAPQCVATP